MTFTNSGIRIAWSGTIMALTMTRKINVEVRKRSLAKANPAGRPISTMTMIDAQQMIVELRTCWPTGITELSALQLPSEKPLTREELRLGLQTVEDHHPERVEHHDGHAQHR